MNLIKKIIGWFMNKSESLRELKDIRDKNKKDISAINSKSDEFTKIIDEKRKETDIKFEAEMKKIQNEINDTVKMTEYVEEEHT